MTRTIFIAAALALAATLPAAPAQAAGAARTFVSAAGSDSNNCTNVADALPAPRDRLCGDGRQRRDIRARSCQLRLADHHRSGQHRRPWLGFDRASERQAAITINANPCDKINIIGVVLDGTAITNTTGIQFNSGGNLTVRDSVIRNFSNNGINFVPNSSTLSQLFVSNTLVSDNTGAGINIDPAGSGTTTGSLDHVEMEHNAGNGLFVQSSTQTVTLAVTDSESSINGSDGIRASATSAGFLYVLVRNCTIANNVANGLDVDR